MPRTATALIVLVLIAGGAVAWLRWHGEAAVVARTLEALAGEINESTTDGAGPAARADQLRRYFIEDVTIDLGRGTAVVRGRATVLDMLSRLQPRTSAFELRLMDIGVTLGPGDRTADVVLTAEFRRRGGGEGSIDARELSLRMTRDDDAWRIAHLAIVEAFR